MNLLVEKGVLQEIDCGSGNNNFAYILNDNSLFLSTEYKVLQSQLDAGLVRCMKMLYNGKIELYYLVENSRPFSAMLSRLEPEQFMIIAGNLLDGIIDVKSNGFLSCNNIDSTFEHIFVDQATLKVKLVYLPISQHEYQDDETFENALRTRLIQVISRIPRLSSSVKTTQLMADLQNGMLSIEEIFGRVGKEAKPPIPAPVPADPTYPDDLGGGKWFFRPNYLTSASVNPDLNPGQSGAATLRLIAIGAPAPFEIAVTRSDFVIGRKETNDGVIAYNNMIGRTHCKVIKNGEQYLLIDLQSVNGTFVNGKRLQPNDPKALNNGDVIRLANSDFKVVIR